MADGLLLYLRKSYTTENTYRSHLSSKKHKDAEKKASLQVCAPVPEPEEDVEMHPSASTKPSQSQSQSQSQGIALTVDVEASEEQVEQTIDEKIAAARSRLTLEQCLFCSESLTSLENNLTHMSAAHSFFVPDAEYLVDISGLIVYLGEKIAVGNVCLYCNRDFRTMDAVRKHMLDKGHCKIAYDSEEERLEISDYYDFTSSYPEAQKKKSNDEGEEEWEDMDDDDDDDNDDGDVDEVVEEGGSSDDEDELSSNQVTYGDTPYELVLPSGARIGHRSMRRYYTQSFIPLARGRKEEDPNSGAAFVRRLLADKNSALIPRKGGFGAYGSGTDVIKARNRGEAREAGRHIRQFRDQKRRQDFQTKVGFIHNNQKHYRDPLLQ